MNYTGRPMKRSEDPRLLRGLGSFVDDIKLPGMLHACVVRSPYAHALISSVDTSAAGSMPGVVAVLTGEDLGGAVGDLAARQSPYLEGVNMPGHPALAGDRVCYVGQPVAVVVAEDPYLAKDAVDAVRVSYQMLPALMDPAEAAGADSTPIHQDLGSNVVMRFQTGRGDVAASFARAGRIVQGCYNVPRLSAAPMEGRGLVAWYQPQEGLLTLWAATQAPYKVKNHLEQLLFPPPAHVRVVAPDVGGGFGQKAETWPEDLAVSLLAIRLERPIKWVEERWENMLAYQARGHSAEVEAAVKSDGTILAMRFRIIADVGAYLLDSSAGPPMMAAQRCAGPYSIPDMDVEVLSVITNRPPTGPYRGAGAPEGAFFMERTIDLIAGELGLDPVEVRRRNLIPPEAFPYTTATGITYDSGDFIPPLEKALDMAGYADFRRARQDRGPGEPLLGIGLATVVKAAGGRGPMMESIARIQVEPSGQVKVYTEVSPHGQGTATTFAQIAADELGIGIDDIHVLHGDTDMLPTGQGTFASRALAVGGSAMYVGLQQVRGKMAAIAAHILECPVENMVFQEGKVFNKLDPEQVMAFSALASAAQQPHLLPPGVEAGLESQAEFGLPGNPYGFGAHIAVVEIDRDTGDVRVVRYVAVQDSGPVVNPTLIEGQVHGGLAQGLGQALTEVMDYSPDGQPLNASFLDYGMPLAQDMPELWLGWTATASPTNPLGVRGVGELPTVAAPAAVVNAVMDALSGAGVRHMDAPLTPEKIWRALRGSSW
ncbi:MAG: xanthine dehydrogenase family protein molybdopterin-binding subunit [Dehalococcoidia bacterium]|nr:xanthine dehydrogenase family protein molybdopterin-binding subunit [Dehalococcoidia bacterium]MDP7085681.1 xanthine dehydrogenase family protein molybdopterin-binding subunit [Dehalococcoidia bacterium]HJN88566.1 xanthine dehydrogenase family protein molybdopterin-binding subunit [Dehalococcoidia bacterium]